MNFVLKPQNFKRQELKFTDQYRTGFAVHDDHLQRQFLRRYMRQVMQRYPVPRRPGFNSRIERRGELDGALFNHDDRERGRSADQHQQQSNHRQFPATPLCNPIARPADCRGASADERGDDRHQRGIITHHCTRGMRIFAEDGVRVAVRSCLIGGSRWLR